MRAVTFVLQHEMADVSIAGLQWSILIPRLNHTRSHRPSDSRSKPYLHREKKYHCIRFGTRITNLLQSYELRGKHLFVSHYSHLLRHTMEKGRCPVLYSKKTQEPTVPRTFELHSLNNVYNGCAKSIGQGQLAPPLRLTLTEIFCC